MNKIKMFYVKYILCFLFILFYINTGSISIAHEESPYHVLALHSYNKGLTWTDNIQRGLEAGLKEITDELYLQVEYMDTKLVKFDEEYKQKLFNLYKYKYANSKFDVIISSDDNALTFLREYHQELFPDTPIIFCGVNNIEASKLVDRNIFTGILEITAERETLDLALRLHPNTKNVTIICDNTPSGDSRWKHVERIFDSYRHLHFKRVDSTFSIDEVEEVVRRGADDTVFLLLTFYRDSTDRYIPLKEAVERISSASSRPIYTYHTQVLLNGTVGGKVLGGRQHGLIAAKMADRFLHGEKIRDITIKDTSLAQYMFDHQELERFSIDQSKLPVDSIILNRPFSFFEEYKVLVWSTLCSTFVLILIIVALVLSIAKRKQVERSLTRSREQLEDTERKIRLLLNSTAEAIIELDKDGSCVFCNPACLLLLGYQQQEELLGRPIHSLISRPLTSDTLDSQKLHKVYQVFQNKKGIHVDEDVLWKADGSSFWSEYWSYPIIKNDEITGAVVTFIDISERVKEKNEKEKLNLQLQQSQKMESIGTLAGGIAHDFNNLLHAITGYVDLLLYDTPKYDPRFHGIAEIKKASNRATELVRQILTFSRRTEPLTQPERLQVILQEPLQLLRSTLPATIEIVTDICTDCGTVLADSTQIHQVIMNLCMNGFYAMRDSKGKLTVCLQEIKVDASFASEIEGLKEGKYAQLTVSDTGTGMDKNIMERVFEPYFTTKGKGEGTGLGLATVHGIVKNHGGAITVKSEVGVGTTFSLFFPVVFSNTPLNEQQKEKVDLPDLQARVLFVDDVDFNVQLGVNCCERLGCEVTGCTSSIDALEIFKQDPARFDIVITDQTMPNLTGFELSQELLKIRQKLPIVMITGYSDAVSEERAKSIGVRAFLMKPIELGRLTETMCELLQQPVE